MTTTQMTHWQRGIAQAKDRFTTISQQASPDQRLIWEKESMYALQILRDKDRLQQCPPETIRDAIINVASVGLSLNPALSLAYLVPRDGICCLDISYKGLVQLATDSGAIRYVRADVVRAGDGFTWNGLDQRPEHSYDPFDSEREDREIVGVYCFAKTSDGDILAGKLARKEIELIRKTSKAPNSPAWKLWYGEMAKKSLIKREQKLWPKSARERISTALEVINDHEGLADEYKSEQVEYYNAPAEKPEPEPEVIEGEAERVEEKGPPMEKRAIGILKRKLKAAGIDETALFNEFQVDDWDGFMDTQKAAVSNWIDGRK